MANALFLSSRAGDRAVLTASSEASGLPAANLQTLRPDRVWRGLGTAESLTLDLVDDVDADALILVGHNLTAAATLRVRGAATEADLTSAPAIDTGAVSAWPASGKPADPDWPVFLSLVRWSNATGYRWWRLDLADAGNPDGYVEAGRLLVGPAFVPAANVDLNVALGLVSPGVVARTAFGATVADHRGAPSRVMTLPMSSLSQRDLLDELFELQRTLGAARDFAFVLDPDATVDFHRFALQALSAPGGQAQALPLWDGDVQLWQTMLTLNEVL